MAPAVQLKLRESQVARAEREQQEAQEKLKSVGFETLIKTQHITHLQKSFTGFCRIY